jgi:uncharacterized protein (TIGR02680 family)
MIMKRKWRKLDMSAKWKLNRAGLLNFWYYDDEVFEFEDGKLLLRGTNGSGKSVTMQSFLPVLLDGKKSADRLDPFGSKSRRMADYLLGEKEISNRDERTGYLYIEYKKEGTEQYLTTGMGMQAKRNQSLKSWGFAITDNRRIGIDLELFKWVNQDGEKVKFPRSQTELETVIGMGGEVVSSNKEYMGLVNKYIFGFETLEAFDDLIKLLIQLRSPKLSKEFKPTVIYEILEEALPPLTDDDLRYLSDSIEQMDQTKQQMEQLEREVKALAKLKNVYEQYNQRILYDQVTEWKQASERMQKEEEEVKRLEQTLLDLELEIGKLANKQTELNIRQETLDDKSKRLATHEVFRLEEELQKKVQAHQELKKEIKNRSERIERMINKELESRKRLKKLDQDMTNQGKKLQELIGDLSYEARQSAFSQHEQNVQDYERRKHEFFEFDLWKKEIHNHTQQLENAFDELRLRDQTMNKIQEKNRELSEEEHERDIAQEEEYRWRDTLSEEKQKLIHQIHLWTEEHHEYQVPSTVLQDMSRLIDDLFSRFEYEEVKELFSPFVHQYEDHLRTERSKLDARRGEFEEELSKLKDEWEKKKAQREPEPERHNATNEARELLEKESVVFAPLYELVEFQSEVSNEVQRRLESALMETGLLDALVTTEKILLQHDRILLADPKLLSHTLADYLQPDQAQTKIPIKHIQDILQSIEMDGEAPVHFGEDGTYQFASLLGHALPIQEVRFIGREARKRYHEELIAKLEDQMEVCTNRIKSLIEEQRSLDEKLKRSRLEWGRFPISADVKTCYKEMKDNQSKVKLRLEQIERLTNYITQLDQELQLLKANLFHLTDGLQLKLSVESYRVALSNSREYEKSLYNIHQEHERFIRFIHDYEKEKENILELQVELDEYRGELNIKNENLSKVEQGISHIHEQLHLVGAEEIRLEIQQVTSELSTVKSEIKVISEQLPTQKEKKKHTEERLVERNSSNKFWSQIATSWEESLRKEWNRGTYEMDNLELFDFDRLKELTKGKASKERAPIEGHLTTQFHTLQPDLMEHKMRMYTHTPEAHGWMNEVLQEEWKPVVEQWKTKNTRNIIEFDQRGVKISPTTLHESVSREWAIQENRLDEMDKKLYEEILLNSVGHKLRGRIRRAEQWTEKMKGLMESRDTSSGLKFSIKWRPRTADSEQEMDTSDLVSLLKQDTNLLNDNDLERITNHFRSKIQAAKTWVEEKGDGHTLLQVLKMVLDYRKWFSFVLYFERPNEPKRELTNHNFFKFSGGEKAMAMYIPLFTACYSRYQEAAPHAPFIISLDEAFAGVDENNIKEMFEIVEQLGFNYIMNSQVLWGDYETISSLSVCELVRPKNANYVTVIRYKWDGQALSVRMPEEVGMI